MTEPRDDDLVTIRTPATEFEAQTLKAVLNEVGIEARVFGVTWSGTATIDGHVGVPLQVRRSDVARSEAALAKNVDDSIDLDWDEVDVGEREDDLPLTSTGSMPILARIGWSIAVILCLITLLGWLARVV